MIRSTGWIACASAALGMVLTACAARSMHGGADMATFVVVRHAEKANDGGRDPSLSEAGKHRADALARMLRNHELRAVYATGFRRTQLTARPSAVEHGLAVTTYDAAQPAADLAAMLRLANDTGTILVVGHSNTVPDIVAALCGCEVDPMAEDRYGDVYRVRLRRGEKAEAVHGSY